MGSSSNTLYNNTFYGYKLQEDLKQESESINGHTFWKDKWTTYKTPPPDFLKTCVRTVINRSGKLQYKEFNPVSEEIFFDSDKYLNSSPKTYSRDLLSIMKRKDLEELSHYYGIDTRNKSDKLLVNIIIEYQEKLKDENLEKVEEETTSITN
jgi:hypothetical protein